jgi:hypothetical protein
MKAVMLFFIVISYLASTCVVSAKDLRMMAPCCKAKNIAECVLKGRSKVNVQSDVLLITMQSNSVFGSEDISVGMKSVYADSNNYELSVFAADSFENKWESVKVLKDIFSKKQNTIRHKYIVWADPKVIFVDMSYRIDQVADKYPHAQFLISTVDSMLTDGFFVLKDSEWSRQFIHDWWNSYDHTTHAPLESLRLLVSQTNNKQYVQLLPPQGLWLYTSVFKERNEKSQVLNMVGEDDIFQSIVFADAWATVCDEAVGGEDVAECVVDDGGGSCQKSLPPLLGLTSRRLEELEELVLPRKLDLLRAVLERAKTMGDKVRSHIDVQSMRLIVCYPVRPT